MDSDFSAEEDASPNAGPVIWDLSGMMGRLMNDEELVDEVLKEFMLDLPKQVEQLERLIAEEDPYQVGRRSHQIKGMAANVGAEALRERAYELEKAGTAGDMELIRRKVSTLSAILEETQSVIRRHLDAS